jgi:glutamine synthetase
MPKNLGEAIAALRACARFHTAFGSAFVDYYAQIKEAELARYLKDQGDSTDVTPWEQKEYLDFF